MARGVQRGSTSSQFTEFILENSIEIWGESLQTGQPRIPLWKKNIQEQVAFIRGRLQQLMAS